MSERPISGAQVAKELLNRSPSWFAQHRAELEAVGFPKPLPVLHSYLPAAVRAWLDSAGGNAAESSAFRNGLDRLLDGKRKGGRSAA